MLPFPGATRTASAAPLAGVPVAAAPVTAGGGPTAAPLVADWLVALVTATVAAAPAVPVAVKVTGLPESDPELAVRVLLPAVALSVQLPTVATPLVLVVWLPPVTVPLPVAAANVTVTPVTGFPFASFTITDGGALTAFPAVADWLVALFAASVAAPPALPAAVQVPGPPR